MNEKWDKRFIDLAEHISRFSKDPSTKCGAVITEGKRIISVGYNGFPAGIEDSEDRLNDRETKYKYIVHCEENAVLFANTDVNGMTLYTWPFLSCNKCAVRMIQAGIKRVVAPKCKNERWKKEIEHSIQIFKEAGVIVVEYEEDLL